jgi:hypothetical protein
MRVFLAAFLASLVLAPSSFAATGKRSAPFTIFPVVGGASFVNDFGDARAQGSHQGNDLMAACGTEALAVVDGRISVSHGSRSGWMITLVGRDNWYRYIHMQGPKGKRSVLPKGLRDGARVKAGQVIGYVGNTGDASHGPCHLHFELHTNARRVLNPYRWLRQAAILERDETTPEAPLQAREVALEARGNLTRFTTTGETGRLAIRLTRLTPSRGKLERTPRIMVVRVPPELVGQVAAIPVGRRVTITTHPVAASKSHLECRPLRWTLATVTPARR